jgi:hypothetical protein
VLSVSVFLFFVVSGSLPSLRGLPFRCRISRAGLRRGLPPRSAARRGGPAYALNTLAGIRDAGATAHRARRHLNVLLHHNQDRGANSAPSLCVCFRQKLRRYISIPRRLGELLSCPLFLATGSVCLDNLPRSQLSLTPTSTRTPSTTRTPHQTTRAPEHPRHPADRTHRIRSPAAALPPVARAAGVAYDKGERCEKGMS